MGHDKSLHDGKKKRDAIKSIKEKRAEKKTRYEELPHAKKRPRWKKEVHL
jgi:hypothetical protein